MNLLNIIVMGAGLWACWDLPTTNFLIADAAMVALYYIGRSK